MKRSRDQPDADDQETQLFGKLLNLVQDERRVCVVGIPTDVGEDDLRVQLSTIFKKNKETNGGTGMYELVGVLIPPNKKHPPPATSQNQNKKQFNVGFIKFVRPEGASFCVEKLRKAHVRSPVGGQSTLSLKRPTGYKKIARPYNDGHFTDGRLPRKGSPKTVELSGSKGGLRNIDRNISDTDLIRVLEHFGHVVAFDHKRDSERISRGVALAEFETIEAASACIRGLNGSVMARPPNVKWTVAAQQSGSSVPKGPSKLCFGFVTGTCSHKKETCNFLHDPRKVLCATFAAAGSSRSELTPEGQLSPSAQHDVSSCPFAHWESSSEEFQQFRDIFELVPASASQPGSSSWKKITGGDQPPSTGGAGLGCRPPLSQRSHDTWERVDILVL